MTFNQLASVWNNPFDLLSLLLLIGGDVVKHALAQQTGDYLPALVVFSFGWVSYSFLGLLAAAGENKLLPAPDISSIVINIGSGFSRYNQSWIIGRIVRDFEQEWIDDKPKHDLQKMLEQERINSNDRHLEKKGLCISVYKVVDTDGKQPGVRERDIYWYSGYIVALVQLCIAMIPGFIWKEWDALLITGIGTSLAFVTGLLPQWRRERWACRMPSNSRKNFALTRGNGSQHVLVILGNGKKVLDLEELASAGEGMSDQLLTRCVYFVLVFCWVGLLISVTGLRKHTWFLVGVGSLGMVHTFLIAGRARMPAAFGLHIEYYKHFVDASVMKCLLKAQKDEDLGFGGLECPNLGWSLVPTFFPGELRENEKNEWLDLTRKAEGKKIFLKVNDLITKADAGEAARLNAAETRLEISPAAADAVNPPNPAFLKALGDAKLAVADGNVGEDSLRTKDLSNDENWKCFKALYKFKQKLEKADRSAE